MSYKVIIDSCGDLSPEMKESGIFQSIPLTIELDGEIIRDDETFDQAEFLKKTAASSGAPKSSCPSPEEFMESYEVDAERIYVVTLSDQLSGTNNSAELAKTLYLEKVPEKKIHVFNSFSASIGETLIALKIQECEEIGMKFQQILETVKDYIKGQNTYFVLECLDTLRKSGRLTGVKSLLSSALNIKPVMSSTDEGTIQHLGQGRGIKSALVKLVDYVARDAKNTEDKILAIAHCNCLQRAQEVKEMLLAKIKVKSVLIVDTAGISTMYANDGGVIVAI